MSIQLKSATAIIGLAVSASVASADTGWSLDSGIVHTDNATLANAVTASDTVASVGGAIAWQEESSRVRASLNGAGGFLHYLDGTFHDDFLGQAIGNAVIQLIPERVSWTFDDSYGQIATDPFGPSTPQNRQNVNALNLGPDIHLRLGDQTHLQLAGRYGDTRYEDSAQINARSWSGSLGLLRELSQATSLGIFASQSRYAYDAPGALQYDQQAGWVSWKSAGARQNLSLELGINRVSRAEESQASPLARVDWQRSVWPSWTMNLQLRSEYQNSGQQFANGNVANVGISSSPASTNQAALSFVFERSRTHFSIGGGLRKVDYVGTGQLDEDARFMHLDLSRRFTPRLQGLLSYRVDQRDYGSGLGIRERVGQAELDWHLGQSAFLTLGYSRRDSHGDGMLNRYSANLFSLRLSWRSGAATMRPRTLGY